MGRIIHSDTLSGLKTLDSNSVDVGVTSPPYNKQGVAGALVKEVEYTDASDNLPESVYQQEQIDVLNELYRVIKYGGSFFYNHKVRTQDGKMVHPMDWLRKTDWIIRQEIVWDRMIAGNLRGWRFWQVEERIYWLYKPRLSKKTDEIESRHAYLSSIWRFPPERDNPHPAAFPLMLPYRAIYSVMDETKGIVIDPYSGSGTTLVAAQIMGHDYIGIDCSTKYIQQAEERLKHHPKDLLRANEERAKHKVNKRNKDSSKIKFDEWFE